MSAKTAIVKHKRLLLALGLLPILAGLSSCVRVSNGVWHLSEAPLPDGWPQLTPVGDIEIKRYPDYRAARVEADAVGSGQQGSLFGELFGHIKRQDIAMTAPVQMNYAGQGERATMISMAFPYRQQTTGPVGQFGRVEVVDAAPQDVVSIGVRGAYTDARLKSNLTLLDQWLSEHEAQWRAAGPPRYLGYNSPFVPSFMRYGEIQIPVSPRGDGPSPRTEAPAPPGGDTVGQE